MSETPNVMVKVSRELLEELGDWSAPVQVMVERQGGEYTIIARRHDCPHPVDDSADNITWDDVVATYRKLTPDGGPSRMPVDNREADCG